MSALIRERPILFSAPMVRAILDGSKTQTRRVMKPQPEGPILCASDNTHRYCPYGITSDRLWVRETFAHEPTRGETWYRADFADGKSHNATMPWKPSIFMPRALSRITLEIVSVRAERLHEISRGDAMAEGCPFPNLNGRVGKTDPVGWYRGLWNALNGADAWDENPWVGVIEFRRVPA